MLGNLTEIVLLTLRQVQISILLCCLITLFVLFCLQLALSSQIIIFFILILPLLFQPGRRLCVLKVKSMLVVPLFDLNIQVVWPVFEVVDVSGDLIIIVFKFLITFWLHIFFVGRNYVIVEEIVLFFRNLFQYHLFFVSNELIVIGLLLFEVDRVETFDCAHLLYRADLSHLVYILEPTFVSHLIYWLKIYNYR